MLTSHTTTAFLYYVQNMLPLRKVLGQILINIPKKFSAENKESFFFYITEYLLSCFYVTLEPHICNTIYLQYYLLRITDNTSAAKKLLACRTGVNAAKSSADASYWTEITMATSMSQRDNTVSRYTHTTQLPA